MVSNIQATLKQKDEIHTAAMESEQKKRVELEALVLSLQRFQDTVQQATVETTDKHLDHPPAQSEPAVPGPSTSAMSNAVVLREETPIIAAAKHAASNFKQQIVVSVASEDAEMRDLSPTNPKWQFRVPSGKERSSRYLSVHSSDDEDPEFCKNWLDDDDMHLVSDLFPSVT